MSFTTAPNTPSNQLLYISKAFDRDILNDTNEWDKLSCYCYAQGYTGIILYQMNQYIVSGSFSPSWAAFITHFQAQGIAVYAAFGGPSVPDAVQNWNTANPTTPFVGCVSEIEWWNYSANMPFQQPGTGAYSFYDTLKNLYDIYYNPLRNYQVLLYLGFTKGQQAAYTRGFEILSVDLPTNSFLIRGDFTVGGDSNGKQYEVGQKIQVENYPATGDLTTYTITSVVNFFGNTRIAVSTPLTTATISSGKIKTYYDVVGFDYVNNYIQVKGDKRFRNQNLHTFPLIPQPDQPGNYNRVNLGAVTGSSGLDGSYNITNITYDSLNDVTNFHVAGFPVPAVPASGWFNPDTNYFRFTTYPGTELQMLFNLADVFLLHNYIATPAYGYSDNRAWELGDAATYFNGIGEPSAVDIGFIVSAEGYHPVVSLNIANGQFTIQGNFASDFVPGRSCQVRNYPTSGTNTTYTISASTNSGPNTIVTLTGGAFPNPNPPANCDLAKGNDFSKYFFLGRDGSGLSFPPKNPIDAYQYIVTPITGNSPSQSGSYAQAETNFGLISYGDVWGIAIFEDQEIRPYSTGNGPNIWLQSASPFIPPGSPQYTVVASGGVGSWTFVDFYCDDCLPNSFYLIQWDMVSFPGGSNPQLVGPVQSTANCNGSTSVLLNFDQPGVYVVSVTITDGVSPQSVSKTGSHTLTVTTPATGFTISASLNGSIDCANNPIGDVDLTITGTHGTVLYDCTITGPLGSLILFDIGQPYTGPNFTFTNLNFIDGSGTYTVFYSDTNTGTATTTFFVSLPVPITTTFITQNSDCNGNNGYAEVVPSGGTAPYTYEWDGNPLLTNNYIDGLDATATSHVVEITDSKGCTGLFFVGIQGPEKWNVTWKFTDTVCCGSNKGSIELDVTAGSGFGGPFNYSWSHNPALNSPLATGLVAGFYTCTIFDAQGCSYTTPPIPIACKNNPPTFTITGPSVFCNLVKSELYEATGVTGSAPFQYQWSNGQTSNPASYSFTNFPVGPQTISCTVTDANGCSTTLTYDVDVTTLGYVPNITVTGTPLTSCAGSQVDIEVTNPDYPGYWDIPGAPTTPLITIDKAWWDVNASPNNPYFFTWVATDPTSTCVVTGTVQVDPPLLIDLVVDVVGPNPCGGPNNVGYIEVTVINGCSPYAFSWSGPPGFVDPGTEDIYNLVDGDYYLTVTDSNTPTPNQKTFGPITVTTSVPTLTGVVTNAGCGALANQGEIDTTVTGGTAPYTYLWDDGETTPDRDNLIPGLYTVTVTDDYGCTDVKSFVVTNDPGVSVVVTGVAPSGPGAMNGSATATATGGATPYTYLWSDGKTTQSISGLDYGTYTVSVTSAGGCVSFGKISFSTDPTAGSGVDRLKCCAASIAYKYVKQRRNGQWEDAECTMNSLMLIIQYIKDICSYMNGGCLSIDEVNSLIAKANQICGCCACASDPFDDTL